MHRVRRTLTVAVSAGVVAAGVLVGGLVGGARAGTSVGAGNGAQFVATQNEFPVQLLVRGDAVTVSYETRTAPEPAGGPVADATGTLYVRSDLQPGFTAVPLTPSVVHGRSFLSASVPAEFLGGQRLFYYGVIRDDRLGGSVTVPAAGAGAPESAWIINDAFRVRLGAHRFGHLRTPEAIVAKAGPKQVGFNYCPPESCGAPFGPLSFEVATNRSVWLFDYLGLAPEKAAGRLLMWAPGRPAAVARTLQFPFGPKGWNRGTEFALGPAGSVYVIRGGLPAPANTGQRLTRLSARGKVLWTSFIFGQLGFNTQLRTGPGGTVYWTGWTEASRDMSGCCQPRWVPVATSDGRPLSLAAQERGTRWAVPLRRGLQLVGASAGTSGEVGRGGGPREARVALIDKAGRVVRAWRVTSTTTILWYWDTTPALVGGDPVVVLTPTAWYRGAERYENLVLRLGPRGGVRTRFSLPYRTQSATDPHPRAVWGSATTFIRVQPDGRLYQMGTSPAAGVAIYRYSLRPTK